MRLIEITNQIRNDCWATLSCEHCGKEVHKVSCYDDDNFWKRVLPSKKCNHCGKCSNDTDTRK